MVKIRLQGPDTFFHTEGECGNANGLPGYNMPEIGSGGAVFNLGAAGACFKKCGSSNSLVSKINEGVTNDLFPQSVATAMKDGLGC